MPSVGRFIEVLEAVSRRDWSALSDVVKDVADAERRQKHFGAAHQLLEALDVVSSDSGFDLVGTMSLSTPEPARPPLDFLQRIDTSAVERPVLSEGVELSLKELLQEWVHEPQLRDAGLSPRSRLLLHGPPGSGKTHLASFVARSLSMPLYLVRFDGLISSLLGETAANVAKVFEFGDQNRCCLLLDEMDAIGKMRDDRHELGELKRVVISLLQNLDTRGGRSLIMASTNHPHLLDPALWRRFDTIWELPLPSVSARRAILEQHCPQGCTEKVLALIASETEGYSGSALHEIGTAAKRRQVIEAELVADEAILLELLKWTGRVAASDDPELKFVQVGRMLRQLSPRKYSFRHLETLTGVPHSTLHHRFKH